MKESGEGSTIVKNSGLEDTYYGIIPIKTGERLYDFKTMIIVSATYAVASWCYVQGAWISSVLPFYLGMFSTLMGIMLFAVPIFIVTVLCCRYGCDIWIYQRALFGKNLNMIILILAALLALGWSAVNARIFAGSTLMVFNEVGMNWGDGAIPWLGSICVISGFIIAFRGPVFVKKFSFLAVPILAGVGLMILFWVFSSVSPNELNAATPVYAEDYGSLNEALMYVMESNFAYCLAWYIMIGVLPRLTKSERGSTWGIILGLGFALTVFVCIGIVTGTYMGMFDIYSEDPTEALLILGGPVGGVISLIGIGVANIGTQAVELYCNAIVTKVLRPSWNYRAVLVVWLAVVLLFTITGVIWEYYSSFVSIGGAVYAPFIALLCVDFFILRKQRFSLKSAYLIENSYEYTKGFNIYSLISLLAGTAVYLMLFDPIAYEARSDIFFVTTATGGAFIASGVLYLIFCMIPSCRKYLLKDQEELDNRLGKDWR